MSSYSSFQTMLYEISQIQGLPETHECPEIELLLDAKWDDRRPYPLRKIKLRSARRNLRQAKLERLYHERDMMVIQDESDMKTLRRIRWEIASLTQEEEEGNE